MTPEIYVGVDINYVDWTDMHDKISKKGCRMWLQGNNNFTDMEYMADRSIESFNLITCFEVLEHMHPRHVLPTIKKIHSLLSDDGVAMISTPVFNGKAASNHINEMTYYAMLNLLITAGFCVERRYGTFASQSEYKGRLDHILDAQGANKIFDMLSEYYDSNVLSTIFAPLIPTLSRNVMWVVSKQPNYEALVHINHPQHQPWSSSDDWEQLFGGDHGQK